MLNFFSNIFGSKNDRILKRMMSLVNTANNMEQELSEKPDSYFLELKDQLLEKYKENNDMYSILPHAFAAVREASKRTIGLRHFDSQMLGGISLAEGNIAEMKTGEGKTLVATLPVYLNYVMENKAVIVTVNDYLARRDAEWMRPVYEFLGLKVGIVNSNQQVKEKIYAYKSDVIYATNNELGFDYLRDNMARSIEERVQCSLDFAIVDEVDSILIDEARTPLIISGQGERPQEKYQKAAELSLALVKAKELSKDGIDPEGDYEVDEKQRSCILTDQGFAKCEEYLGVNDLYNPQDPWAHYITNALKAKELFIKDVNYIIKNDEAVIVDEFTGRVMPGRRWSDGQHQAIEAKESLKIQPETQTLASITYQNFFLLYPGLAGMTGTAKTEEVEFEKTYKLESTVIPTNQIRKRQDWSDQVFKTEIGKWKAVAKETAQIHREGRPVLVGTTSVEKSELLSSLLTEEKIPHNLLKAKPENVEREAEIVAQAGRAGAVTIATNMAGRGTDIILGGNSDYMARLKLKEILIPLLVKPDNEHKPPIPKQRNTKSKGGFSKKSSSILKKIF